MGQARRVGYTRNEGGTYLYLDIDIETYHDVVGSVETESGYSVVVIGQFQQSGAADVAIPTTVAIRVWGNLTALPVGTERYVSAVVDSKCRNSSLGVMSASEVGQRLEAPCSWLGYVYSHPCTLRKC